MEGDGRRPNLSLRDLRPLDGTADQEPEPLPPIRIVDRPAAHRSPLYPLFTGPVEILGTEPVTLGGVVHRVEDAAVPHDLGPRSGPMIIADRYEAEATIGEGGMGRVYKVRHRTLGKHFALKLMQTQFVGDSLAREQFYREARLASSLAHPNIVSVIDFGEDPALGVFMVMELLEGVALADRLQSERFSMRAACDIILQIAEALSYIHKRQIVHCDIKPENILLVPAPPGERRRQIVKLLDFGLARLDSSTPGTSRTIDGTPGYIAPERIQGGAPVPSMDIYSLGILAYEVFTGTLPFGGDVREMLQHHLHTPAPPIASRRGEAIDERAEALVMKALAKAPRDRQRDMAALVYELRTLIDMLGFGRRRGGPAGHGVRRAPRDRQTRTAAAYDLAPLPMAGLDVDGTIVIANRAFTQFVLGDGLDTVEATSIHATAFLDIHPGLSADLRRVHVSNEQVRRFLDLTRDGEPIRLMLLFHPGAPGAGEIQLLICPIGGAASEP